MPPSVRAARSRHLPRPRIRACKLTRSRPGKRRQRPLLRLRQTTAFPSWSTWFARQGYHREHISEGFKINSAAAVIQAALAAQGVALARRRFVANELQTGQLVRLLPEISWPVPWRYFIVQPLHLALPEPVVQFRQWLLHEAEFGH